MFKLESYVTPLLLSYVDKYIKNLKPEDSQLSLWGGDASFCNLDLRLDVLEKELDLPFTFVNGHIHELRIHVPWTKLGSEPVVITINTIECILKLHSENDVEEGTSRSQSSSATSALAKKFPRKQDGKPLPPEAPPGYVQGLINRVLGNICIVCNNLILKYVEDDIVLSLNIKSAELFNVNEKWERTFIDTYPALTVRKIISMQDLTVCLDKRDGSGKIETYQDPLLYRCSTVWRLYSVYNISHSKSPVITRINMYCDQLDFSLTDQQLPMFLRLLKLCYALHCKNYCLTPKKQRYPEDIDCKNQNCDDEPDSPDIEDEGWGSWAWSYIPQVFPVWTEESDVNAADSDSIKSKRIFQFGIFIDKASCVFKITEMIPDSCYGSPKFSFTPFAILHQYGCSIELTVKGNEFLNVQFGVTCATICGLNKCVCGGKHFSNSSRMEKPFLRAGVPLGTGDSYNFLSSTLFDPLAPENCGQKRNYCFDQQLHLSQFSEEVLVKRFPAIAFDYIYELQIPEEWIDKASLVTTTFLEESNWRENSVCRFVVGPSCTDIDSSMVHFITKLIQCSKDYDYPPYFSPESGKDSSNLVTKDTDDIQCLEEFVPSRSYHLTCFKPVLRLFAADHLHCDAPSKSEKRRLKKKKKYDSLKEQALPPALLLKISTECIDVQLHTPMYPTKMARIVSKLEKPPENLIYYCSNNFSIKLFGAGVSLLKYQSIDLSEKVLIPSFSITWFKKSLCKAEYWIKQNDFPLEEYNFECSHIQIIFTEPVLFTLLCIYQSWMKKDFIFDHLTNFTSVSDRIRGNSDILHCSVKGMEGSAVLTQSVVACKGSISSICVKLRNQEHSTVLFHGPECTSDAYKGQFLAEYDETRSLNIDNVRMPPLFQVLFQFPRKDFYDAWLFVIYMRGITVYLEPALVNWFSHDLNKYLAANVRSSSNLVSPTSFEDSSTCSSATPIASGSLSVSQYQSVRPENNIEDLYEDMQKYLLQNYDIFKNLKLQVKVESTVILIPNSCWCVESVENTAALECWAKAFNNRRLTTACVVCLPEVTIKSNSSHLYCDQISNIPGVKLPLNVIKTENKGLDFFPWIFEIMEFSVFTINSQEKMENIFYLWSPSCATSTVAVTSKSNQSQLAVCVHVDTTAVNISYSASQIQLIVDSLNTIALLANSFNTINSWLMIFIQKCEETNYILTSKSTCDTTKDTVFKDAKLSANDEKSNPNLEDQGDSNKTVSKTKQKVTLWFQLTLSKCSISFFGSCESSSNMCFQCQFVTEEVITSLDIQDVYSKGKMKISSLNINYYLRNSISSAWYLGLHDGIVMCCTHKLRRNIKSSSYGDNIADHTNAVTESQPFLLITYTRALSVHAKQKWIAFTDEDCITNNAAKYISELDINIKSFDLILWGFLFQTIYDACFPLSNVWFVESLLKPRKYESSSSPTGINFSNQTLPLLYVNTSSVRMFLPKTFFPYDSVKQKSEKTNSDHVHNVAPDMLLLFVDHICLTSQVENPLTRIVLNPNLYNAALNSKTLMLPGSDIEDRQYQLDIYGLTIGSVISNDITVNHSVCELPRGYMQIMGENPALEWNIGVVSESRKQGTEEPLLMSPLLSAVDIKLAVAPTIVSKNASSKGRTENIIVAGITVEISIVNEIFIYFSARQLELLKLVMDNSQNLIFQIKQKNIFKERIYISTLQPQSKDILQDSGVESEASTFIQFDLPDLPIKLNNMYNFVPFEVLITAGSISVILFVHEEDLMNKNNFDYEKIDGDTPTSESTSALETSTIPIIDTYISKNHAYSSSQPNIRKTFNDCQKKGSVHKKRVCSVNSQNAQIMHPIMLVSVTQPHSFFKIYTSSQRFEISCFDINVRGSLPNRVIASDSSMTVPSINDFPLPYLETKPGEADEKTGIPPAFWTITCTDFLHLPSKMQLRVERPVKFNVDSYLFNQVELVLKSLERKVTNSHVVPHTYPNAELPETCESNGSMHCNNAKFDFLSLFGKVELHTTQIVVEVNIKETETPTTLISSLDVLKGEFVFESTKHSTKSFKLHIDLTGLVYKVLVSGELWPFLFPVSMALSLKCQLDPYFHMKISVDGETIFINFRVKHFIAQLKAIDYIIKKLRSDVPFAFSNNTQDNTSSVYDDSKSYPKKLYWHDDLRKGLFYFNQTFNQTSSKPDVYEIIFSKAEQNKPAAMTWRYPQPRVLTKIEVSPVPFHCTVDQQLGDNTLQMVTCYIQFWDSSHHKFVNKCSFQLSEAVHNHLEFPVNSNISMEFSDVWRVILDYGDVPVDSNYAKNEKSLLSPLALAACLCIDSCFDPSIIPSIQFACSLSLMKLNLYNSFSRTEESYNKFLPFTFDDAAPSNQEFITVSIEKPNFYCSKWLTGFKIEGCFEMGCDVLEYKNLTMVPFINSFDVQIDGHACYEKSRIPVLELEIIFQPCFIRMAQSIVHTLRHAIYYSSLELNETMQVPCIEFNLPNYFIICNNTQESLRLGQVNTEENIFLPSQKMHSYSWRSHKYDQNLQISFECTKWVWSEPFSMEPCGLQKVCLGPDIFVHVKVKPVSNLQKQVVIEGELIIYNCLNLELSLRLSINNPAFLENVSATKLIACSMKKFAAITFIVSRSEQVNMSLSLIENGDAFSSKWINVDETLYELISIQGEEMSTKTLLVQIANKVLNTFHFTIVSVCPPYVIRNYLPCAIVKNEKLSESETSGIIIPGKGGETQFLHNLNFNQDIEIIFQETYSVKTSIPTFEIMQSGSGKHVTKNKNMKVLDELLLSEVESTAFFKDEQTFWSFCSAKLCDSLSKDEGKCCGNNFLIDALTIQPKISNPKIIAEAKYNDNCFNSVFVDVKPWALFYNKTEVNFLLVDLNRKEYSLPPNSVIMPPFIAECFHLAVEFENKKILSSPLYLLEEKASKRFTIEGEIPQNGMVDIVIPIETEQVKLCVFCIKSEIHNGIRVITLLPLMHLKNNTNYEFVLSLCATQLQSCNVYDNQLRSEIFSSSSSSMQLMFWGSDNVNFNLSSHRKMQMDFYITLSLNNGQEPQLSCPLYFSSSLPIDMRHAFAFPSASSNSCSIPFILTSHQREGFWYLVISCDPSPLILLHNRTSILFLYGQNVKSENAIVCEELKAKLPLPSLSPGQSSYYTFPDLQKYFPKLVEPFPKLRLGCEDKTTQSCVWSPPIDIDIDNQFVCIPEICYVKISRERIGHSINLFIDLVNRIEFTANEIRSRIGITNDRTLYCSGSDIQLENTLLKKSECTQKSSGKPKKATFHFRNEHTGEHSSKVPFSLCVTLKANHVSLAICDELKSPQFCSEVVRFNMQNILLYSRSNEKSNTFNNTYNVCFCIGDIQIDNQIDHEGNIVYDFPIVLKQRYAMKPTLEDFILTLPNKARENAFMVFEAVLEIQPVEKAYVFQEVKISFKPIALYFEDAFYYKVLNLCKVYIPPNFHCHPFDYDFLGFPKDVICMGTAFVYPVRIKHLYIDVPEIYLSVHASLKLYLSIENSLLKFQPFSKSEIFTNFYELGRVVVIHYLTGALLRAGWVVGSLDLLGNPANFARAIGSGIADFVLMPYHGLLNGPRAFVSGLTNGAVSLISGISAGAITCVTNLASSISRNMDLLSFDAEHLAHQEMLRHRLPEGVTSGLLQGLSGLGISLLGAVAGVVDHPLQVLVTPTNPINTAKGIVGGLGKGILGILTKPVGGAAVFVSQAGRGILHEAGWSVQCKRQYQSYSAQTEGFLNSLLKYKWKVFQTSAFGEVLISIEATHLDENGYYEENILILTSEVLCLFDPEDDVQRRTFALSEIKCHMSEKDQSAIVINHCQLQKANLFQEISDVSDRVADYVQKSCLYKSGAMQFSFDEETNISTFEFYVQPNLRGLFLALFSLAKRTLYKKGFPMF